MELSPWANHSWSVPLYVTPLGLTTSSIPYGGRIFSIGFDFQRHQLLIRASDGASRTLRLEPKSVAQFYLEVRAALKELDLAVQIHELPNELPDPIPFSEDHVHDTYVPEHAQALWGALVQGDRVMQEFRAGFRGKVSPVHFFWGSFDLAVTRFSGREAPEHPGGIPHLPDVVTREAYSHEVSSAGFWPGNRENPEPIFYSYAYPSPAGFSEANVAPEAAFWLAGLGEFAVPYQAIREHSSPDDAAHAFFQSTYDAAAHLAKWDRETLEWERGFRPLRRAED